MYTVAAGDTAGAVSFTIDGADLSGNALAQVTSVTDGSAARILLPITDATIFAAVQECRDESPTFDCPASQATYGPIEDWDVSAVTSLNNWGSGCTENAEWQCGRASPIQQRLSDELFASDFSLGCCRTQCFSSARTLIETSLGGM